MVRLQAEAASGAACVQQLTVSLVSAELEAAPQQACR